MHALVRICIAGLLATVVGSATQAASITVNSLHFSADTPQSAWSSGPGTTESATFGVSTEFGASYSDGVISGSASAPNPDYDDAIRLYEAAVAEFERLQDNYETAVDNRRAIVNSNAIARQIYEDTIDAFGCGRICEEAALAVLEAALKTVPTLPPAPRAPDPVTEPVTIDTRLGDNVTLNVAGSAGLSATVDVSAGTVDPELEYSATIEAPDEVEAGEFVQLTTTGRLNDGAINGVSPTFGASIDATLKIDQADLQIINCLTPGNCTILGDTSEDANGSEKRQRVLTVTPDEIRAMDEDFSAEVLANFGTPDDAGDPKIDSELNLGVEINIDTTSTTVPVGLTVNGIGVPPEFVFGVGVDVAEATVEFPTIEIQGSLENGVIRGRETDDFLTTGLDLDSALQAFGGLNAGNSFVSASADAWDITGEVSFDAFQELEISSNLRLRLDFDRLVMVDGLGDTEFLDILVGDPMPLMSFYESTSITPTFYVNATLHNVTGLQPGLAIEGDVLKGEICFGPVCENLFGPVETFLEEELTSSSVSNSLIDQYVGLTGFNQVALDPFRVSVTPGEGLAAVPIPSSASLLLGAFAILLGHRRVAKTR